MCTALVFIVFYYSKMLSNSLKSATTSISKNEQRLTYFRAKYEDFRAKHQDATLNYSISIVELEAALTKERNQKEKCLKELMELKKVIKNLEGEKKDTNERISRAGHLLNIE